MLLGGEYLILDRQVLKILYVISNKTYNDHNFFSGLIDKNIKFSVHLLWVIIFVAYTAVTHFFFRLFLVVCYKHTNGFNVIFCQGN